MTSSDSSRHADEAHSRRTLFTLLGVPWQWTPQACLFIPTRLVSCIVVALLLLQNESIGARIFGGVIYALLLLLTQCLHIVGHTLSSKYVGAPMRANLIIETKILTDYSHDPDDLPRRVHLGRALGGPLANIVVGASAAAAWAWLDGHVLFAFAVMNLLLGFSVLLPFPSVDGEVIWRELRR
jgi:hypothetical protein